MAIAETAPAVADETAPAPAPQNAYTIIRAKLFILVIGIIITLALLVLVIWLSLVLKPSTPDCSLQKFYIPALNKASNDLQTINSTAISFELSFWNGNIDKSYSYDYVNVTFYYYGNSLSLPIGNISIPGFYQRYQRTKYLAETIQAFGVPWEDIRMKVSNGSIALFRVDLAINVRIDTKVWTKTRHMLKLGVNVTVNDHGMKSGKKSLRLK
ncbi:hypothetical protein MKX01_022168 [Papaver californicum]|nr:hypothetical protein MKX01_022168 [Papaver californicum]